MKGDEGPYINDDGDVWVPRTVPYLEARKVARGGYYEFGRDRLVYIGKEDSYLLGFTRDCGCEETCYGGPVNEEWDQPDPDPACKVPAWHFRLEEAR